MTYGQIVNEGSVPVRYNKVQENDSLPNIGLKMPKNKLSAPTFIVLGNVVRLMCTICLPKPLLTAIWIRLAWTMAKTCLSSVHCT